MSILIDSTTRVIVQKMTGREGRFHTEQMLQYGTKIVAGVAPYKSGESVAGLPVYDSIKQALAEHDADASIVFVPAARAPDAILEAADARIPLIVCITEGIPVLDMVTIYAHVQRRGSRLIGPNCPGLISPGACKLGIMPEGVYSAGPVGVVARSGTLAYEVAAELTKRGIGQSTCVGIGGDPDSRLFLCRHPRDVRKRPGHKGGHADRGDRRQRRGGGSRFHRVEDEQTGSGLDRRQDGPGREAHGTRGRDHIGWAGQCRREDRSATRGWGNRRRYHRRARRAGR